MKTKIKFKKKGKKISAWNVQRGYIYVENVAGYESNLHQRLAGNATF